MKNSAIITILASAAVATAQVTIDNGTYTCSKPNVAFCAGGSMKTDIIVRCDSTGRGQPGRCSDNLAGEPPVGNLPSLCYETDPTVGDAACEKNCIVYGGSGNGAGTFTLPADQCTPTFSVTGTSGGATTTETQCGQCESSTSTTECETTPTPEPETSTTEVVTEETTICPSSSGGVPPPPPNEETSTPPAVPTSAPSVPTSAPVVPTSAPVYPTGGNGTIITSVPPTTQQTSQTTATPVFPPTSTSPSVLPTAGAAVNAAGGLLAGLGLAVAYFI